MASTAPPPPISSPVIASSSSTAGPPRLPRPASAPSTGAGGVPSGTTTPTPENTHVSESAYEFLLAEILQWVERDEKRIAEEARRLAAAVTANQSSATTGEQQGGSSSADNDTEDAEGKSKEEAAAAVMAAERSAARIERMGYDVGYRLCERLAQHRPLLGPGSPSPEADNSVGTPTDGANLAGVGNNPIIMGGGGHNTTMDPKTQLEAVKFLCKEFWTEVFRKQIDKLQTNHRGVFVLKDLELKWLRRLPPDEESARVGAIRILAFPCGLIRGALACLGLNGAVVSCDFLADGRTMASCSFNIKVK